MSHYKEREEKVCLNCNAQVHGRFCHVCGQENREPKSTAWGLITHFFYDITHFDGKFFSTTGRLLSRPGLLPKHYISGRRASYLDPIRMYIFSSAIFFLIFIPLYKLDKIDEDDMPAKKVSTIMNRTRAELLENAANASDSLMIIQQLEQTDSALAAVFSGDTSEKKKSSDSTGKRKEENNRLFRFAGSDTEFKTREAYDSAQATLPPEQRDGWFKRRIEYRSIDLNNRILKDQNKFWNDVVYKFVHSFPYMLFISLPLYALWLKLLYIRRKKFYYVDHGIFLIFLYIFTFLFLLIGIGVHQLAEWSNWDFFYYVLIAMFLWGIYYAWRAMYKFYEQGRFKTTIKFLLFNFLCFFSLILLFGLLFTLTIFSI